MLLYSLLINRIRVLEIEKGSSIRTREGTRLEGRILRGPSAAVVVGVLEHKGP